MFARFLPSQLVRIDLADGETLGGVPGPDTLEIAPVPGLSLWDALVATGCPIEPAIPEVVSRLGLKRALAQRGSWPSVRAALAADPDRQEEWDLATGIRRGDPILAAIAADLGLAAGEVDDVLVLAASLGG